MANKIVSLLLFSCCSCLGYSKYVHHKKQITEIWNNFTKSAEVYMDNMFSSNC